MDRSGSRDQGPGRQYRDAAFQQSTSCVHAAAAGARSPEPFCQWCATPSRICHPSQKRCQGDRRGGGTQRRACAIDESAHGTIAEPQRRGHLLVAVARDRSPQEGVALHLRQRGEAGESLTHRDPPLEVPVRGGCALERLAELLVVVTGGTERVDGGVVNDAEQPRPCVSHFGAALECQPGLQQTLLDRVVGRALGQEQTSAVAQQPPAVALNQRLESPFVTLTRGGEEALI
jgi:hypothetical protein